MNEEYKIAFIFKYNDKISSFALEEALVTNNDIFLNGKYKGKNYNEIFDIFSSNNEIYSTDVSSIERGFVIIYPFEYYDLQKTIKNIFDDTFSLFTITFKIYTYNTLDKDLILKVEHLDFNKNQIKTMMQIYKAKIFSMISDILKEEIKDDFDDLEKNNIINNPFKENNVKIYNKVDDLINKVKEVVVAQDEAVEKIIPSILINQKLVDINNDNFLKTQKNSILLDGPTGSGKTLIIEEISKLLKIPMVISSITKFTPSGYVGDSIEDVLYELYRKSNENILLARRGIICFDEIDKLGDSSLELRKGLSHELLSWINGCNVVINYNNKKITFNTKYITFITLGAFSKMRNKKSNIGFESVRTSNKTSFESEDYINFGMQREFMARFNNIISMHELSENDLTNILLYSNISPLKNFIELASIYNVDVLYDKDFKKKIAYLAKKDNNGARSLQRIMNKIKDKYILEILKENINRIYLTADTLEDNYKLKKTF